MLVVISGAAGPRTDHSIARTLVMYKKSKYELSKYVI